jgi:hypothetical protein
MLEVDMRIELLECEIWDVVRASIQTGTMVHVIEAASGIAARHRQVMSVAEIAELLADAAVAASVPVEIEGLPPTPRSPRFAPAIPARLALAAMLRDGRVSES